MTKTLTVPKEIRTLKIRDSKDLTEATEVLSKANRHLDTLTKEKELLTKPLNATLKEIRSRYKPIEEKLEQVISQIRSEMTKYQTEQVYLQNRKEAEITKKLTSGKIDVDTAITKMESIKTESKIKTDSGSLRFKTVRKFRVKDWSKVPHQFLLLNDEMVRKMDAKITGIEYWNEELPINSR